jgi:hypothetical protein
MKRAKKTQVFKYLNKAAHDQHKASPVFRCPYFFCSDGLILMSCCVSGKLAIEVSTVIMFKQVRSVYSHLCYWTIANMFVS